MQSFTKRPTGTRDTTNKKQHRKHKDQKTPDTKGQPEQAEENRPHDTGLSTPPGERKQTRKKPRKHKSNQSIGQTKRDAQSADRHTSTKGVKIYLCGGRTEVNVRMYLSSLRGCTQACTQCKRDQDLSTTVVETGKKRGTVHLSSLRTDTHAQSYFCTLVKHEG